jgi:hypothetical protein
MYAFTSASVQWAKNGEGIVMVVQVEVECPDRLTGFIGVEGL